MSATSNGPDDDRPDGNGRDTPPDGSAGTRVPAREDRPDLASPLLDLRDKPPEPLAPSPQALGVWELAWPTILASAMQTMVRWADVKMVGTLGVDSVAAVMGGGNFYWFIQSVVMALTTGLTALLARSVGAGDMRFADATLRQSILLGSVVALVMMLAGIPLTDFAMGLYGLEQNVVEQGSVYLFWLLIGNVPFTLTFVFATALRAGGDARTPLWIGIIANLINVWLNWVLIYGNLGAPALGVAGAAIASSLAMIFQVVLFWWLWARGSLVLKAGRGGFRPDYGIWLRITRIGYPAMIESALFSFGLFAFMRLMSEYGTAEFTAYNIGAQVLSFAFLPGFGFATAASTLVGQHLGEGSPQHAARSGWRSTWLSVASMSAIGAVTIAFAEPIAAWFVPDREVVDLTVDFIWVLGVAMPFIAVEFAIGGALRGAGDTRFPLLCVFIGLFIFRLGTASVAVFAFAASIQLVWSALLLDYGVKALLLVVRFARGRWQTIQV